MLQEYTSGNSEVHGPTKVASVATSEHRSFSQGGISPDPSSFYVLTQTLPLPNHFKMLLVPLHTANYSIHCQEHSNVLEGLVCMSFMVSDAGP